MSGADLVSRKKDKQGSCKNVSSFPLSEVTTEGACAVDNNCWGRLKIGTMFRFRIRGQNTEKRQKDHQMTWCKLQTNILQQSLKQLYEEGEMVWEDKLGRKWKSGGKKEI